MNVSLYNLVFILHCRSKIVFLTAIICLSLTSPPNGSLVYTSAAIGNGSYPFNTMATYSCNTGFSLVGENNRTCNGDGSSTTGTFNVIASRKWL